jgi:hypothetical protein
MSALSFSALRLRALLAAVERLPREARDHFIERETDDDAEQCHERDGQWLPHDYGRRQNSSSV